MPAPHLTDVQKLSLSPSTPVGSFVVVTDSCVVAGHSDPKVNGYFIPFGASNGKTQYRNVKPTGLAVLGGTGDINLWYLEYTGTSWRVTNFNDVDIFATNGNEDYPWQAHWTGLTITAPPIVQQLIAPSTSPAISVLGGTLPGIYRPNGVTHEGKAQFQIQGAARVTDGTITWYNDPYNTAPDGNGPYGGPAWLICNLSRASTYYSHDNVATPDLVTTWQQVIDDSPIALVLTNVTMGEADAGCVDENGVIYVPFDYSTGHSIFGAVGSEGDGFYAPQVSFYTSNKWNRGSGAAISLTTAYAPWLASWTAPVAFTRNNVSAQKNWVFGTLPPPTTGDYNPGNPLNESSDLKPSSEPPVSDWTFEGNPNP